MKRKLSFLTLIPLLAVLVSASGTPASGGQQLSRSSELGSPLSTAFTYQGRLEDTNGPVSNNCDLEFGLFGSYGGSDQLGSTVLREDVLVADGYFTIDDLDFGPAVFQGEARWLEIAVRCPSGTGAFERLSPRQALTASPYALYALSAGSAPWSGLTGVPAGFADGVDDDTTTFWGLSGSSGTNPESNYLGTSDNQPLVLRVNATDALRLEPTSGTPNLVGGFSGNSVTAGVYGAVIAGGGESGLTNRVTDHYGTVGGGRWNQAGDNAGTLDDTDYATVGGGSGNTASGSYATVGGGDHNTASGSYATVGGGWFNTAGGLDSTVGGGDQNTASGINATVGGGDSNTASGWDSTVPGGRDNAATGDNSFAAGRRAKANHNGAFVWADSSDFNFTSPLGNSFSARATGGFQLVAGIDDNGEADWTCWFTNGTSWSCSSDRDQKENFQAVDGRAVLEKVSQLPMQYWNAKGADPAVKHLGPMAQDFSAAFGLGDDDTRIATIDLDGVALAAIQGLYQLSQEQQARIAALEDQLEGQQGHIEALEARLAALEGNAQPGRTGDPQTLGYLPYFGLAALGIGFVWRSRKRGAER